MVNTCHRCGGLEYSAVSVEQFDSQGEGLLHTFWLCSKCTSDMWDWLGPVAKPLFHRIGTVTHVSNNSFTAIVGLSPEPENKKHVKIVIPSLSADENPEIQVGATFDWIMTENANGDRFSHISFRETPGAEEISSSYSVWCEAVVTEGVASAT